MVRMSERNQEKSDLGIPPRSNEQKLSWRSDPVVGEARIVVGFGRTTTIHTETIRGSSELLEGGKQIPVDVVVVNKAHQVVALLNLK